MSQHLSVVPHGDTRTHPCLHRTPAASERKDGYTKPPLLPTSVHFLLWSWRILSVIRKSESFSSPISPSTRHNGRIGIHAAKLLVANTVHSPPKQSKGQQRSCRKKIKA